MYVTKTVALIAYYLFARHLPASSSRPGKWARYVRRLICKKIFKSSGKNINIEKGAYFGDGTKIEIGDNSGIGINCIVCGPVKIGNDVMMGEDVIILTQNHKFDRLDVPMRQQGFYPSAPVVVGDDVWIGTRVIILPGITIGKGVIIGAGAIVTKNIPEYAVAVGNPAKVIKYRGRG